MYSVDNKKFDEIFDAMNYCKTGLPDAVVTDENGTVLMRHEEVPIEDIVSLILAQRVLELQRSL
jgi:hypothetical protein